MKKSEHNFNLLENFILHLTHCSNDESERDFKEEMTFTPELLYKVVDDYIEEDHVDGKENDYEIIIPKELHEKNFYSWQETHFEVVSQITYYWRQDKIESPIVLDRVESQGTGGLYELAKELTDEFEKMNEGRQWDGEFFDEIGEFLEKKLLADLDN